MGRISDMKARYDTDRGLTPLCSVGYFFYHRIRCIKADMRAQELCESRGGHCRLLSLISLWFLLT